MSAAAATHEPVLRVRDLATEAKVGGRWVPILRGVDLDVAAGETVGVAGESGSGKSMFALSVLGLLPTHGVRVVPPSAISFNGVDLLAASHRLKRSLLGNQLCAVFQDPLTSLNPLFPVGEQIAEVIRHHGNTDRKAARRKAVSLLESVHIPQAARRVDSYPHELSGGQRQRVAIAIAIANDPVLLIADEPTTALDVTVQAEILELFAELQERTGMALIFITHDLGVAHDICDTVAVMYAGRIVEQSSVRALFDRPLHPYSRRLMACAPQIDSDDPLDPIPGMPPAPGSIKHGCSFADRCDVADAACHRGDIPLFPVDGGLVACIRPGARPGDGDERDLREATGDRASAAIPGDANRGAGT